MRWASAVSLDADPAVAIGEVVASVERSLSGAPAHLALVFASPHHAAAYDVIGAAIAAELGDAVVIGCSGGGIIGAGREIEHQPGISLTVGSLPGAAVVPFVSRMEDLPSGEDEALWRAALRVDEDPSALLLLPDPFTFDAESVLGRLDAAFPRAVKIGGLASGATRPGQNALFLADRVVREGVVGVALAGNVRIDSVVAQGCRPIGEPMFVTASERNLVRQLDGRPAFEVLRDLVERLQPYDLELARHSLFVGLVMRRHRESYGKGDFLIRNLMGLDPESGVVAVGSLVEAGAVLQFHLRDAATSADDLESLLTSHRAAHPDPPAAALLFSCLGRGVGLYGKPDHDSALIRRQLGDLSVGGFFCNGEIGPVQGQTYLHGYTSALAIFREASS